jgi:hypothetical protein
VPVIERLRPVGLRAYDDRRAGSVRQSQPLRLGRESRPGLDQVLGGNAVSVPLPANLDRDAGQMAFAHRHSGTGSAYSAGGWYKLAAISPTRIGRLKATQDLVGLSFNLLLFLGDIGHDVVKDVKAGNPWVAGARDRLKRSHLHPAEAAKRICQRLESQSELDRRAVRIGDEQAGPSSAGLLNRKHTQMLGVYLGYKKGDIGGHPMAACVAEYRVSRGR